MSPVNPPARPLANPFHVGGPTPPGHFVGRAKEVLAAFDQILARGHLAVYGAPGMGKSSLLRYLAAPEPWAHQAVVHDQHIIVYLNCTGIDPFTPSAFWEAVLRELGGAPGLDAAVRAAVDAALAHPAPWEKADLRQVLRRIGEKGRVLVLLLDDYDAALRASAKYAEPEMVGFLNDFRNLAVHCPEGQHLASVVTTFRRLNELGPGLTPAGSPWYNHYKFQSLKPLAKADIQSLLARMPAAFALAPEQQAGIVEIAGGHPALLQNACSLVFEARRAGDTDGDDELARRLADATEHFYRDAWVASTDVERMLMMLVALANLGGRLDAKRRYDLGAVDSIFSQRERELRDLEERAILRRVTVDDRQQHFFVSAIMEWWVIKEIESARDDAEIERRREILLGLSRKQVDQIMGVVRKVWANKDAIDAVVKWVGKLAGSFAKAAAGGA